jgi:hypothetical protein
MVSEPLRSPSADRQAARKRGSGAGQHCSLGTLPKGNIRALNAIEFTANSRSKRRCFRVLAASKTPSFVVEFFEMHEVGDLLLARCAKDHRGLRRRQMMTARSSTGSTSIQPHRRSYAAAIIPP